MKLKATKVDNNYGGTYVAEYTVSQEKTLRDEFAMAALAGMLAGKESNLGTSAQDAYAYADSMMKARNPVLKSKGE